MSDAIPYFTAGDLAAVAQQSALIAALRDAFAAEVEVPQRTHLDVEVPGARNGTLLLMPAWVPGSDLGVKIASVFPDNGAHDLPSVCATYLLLSATTGLPRAILDGRYLTSCRTAAVSGLAASYLARDDAKRLLLVGTGNLIPHLLDTHRAVRALDDVMLWGRDFAKASHLAASLSATHGVAVTAVPNLRAACETADVISCATLAEAPLVEGAWLRPGTHLDLVGSFKPSMREADDAALQRARIFADDRTGALHEAGELVQAIAAGAIGPDAVLGDLGDLTRGTLRGRTRDDEITLFKSVGTARADLAAAALLVSRLA